MARWWIYLAGVGSLLILRVVCQAGERQGEEVTPTPTVTSTPLLQGEEILLSLCPPKNSLPFKLPKIKKSILVVSTLDGQLTALDLANSGEMVWSTPTSPGPMLSSTISNMELDDRGQWMKLIPSLTGRLYKFNGEHVEPMNVDANSFVSYSLKMQKNLIFTGGRESRTLGIDLNTGAIQYECSMDGNCVKYATKDSILKDIIVVQRNTQTVKAHEPRTGEEKWNFSVSLHDVDYHPGQDLCEDVEVELLDNSEEEEDFDLKTVVPEGVICAVDNNNGDLIRWKRKFETPIVDAWKIRAGKIHKVDLFSRNSVPRRESLLDDDDDPDDDPPQLYIGRHDNQLYIQESILMHMETEKGLKDYNLNPSGAETVYPRVSWKPYLVSPSRTPYYNHGPGPWQGLPLLTFDQKMKEADAKSTALAITRDDAQYPYDSGYFLYPDRVLLSNDSEIVDPRDEEEEEEEHFPAVSVQFIYMNLWYWWKEVIFISLVTAFMMNYLIYRPLAEMNLARSRETLIRYFQANTEVKETIVVVKVPVEVEVPVQVYHQPTTTGSTPLTPSTNSDVDFSDLGRNNLNFSSRYLSDFHPLVCLGRGGFGVVFESKNKYDDIHYAVKRITLSGGEDRRRKVKREVRVLAKLDHKNIVRYFSSWEETPPIGWQEERDVWFADTDTVSGLSHHRSGDGTSLDSSQAPDTSVSKSSKARNPMEPFQGFRASPFSLKENFSNQTNSFSVVFENSVSETCDKHSFDSNHSSHGDHHTQSSAGAFDSLIGEHNCSTEAVCVRIDSSSGEDDTGVSQSQEIQSHSLSCVEAIQWKDNQHNEIEEKKEEKQPRQKTYLYIVMQLCHKETLRDWLRINTSRTRGEGLDIFRQICVGVEYVHSMGLVHRDLKPSNIYFSTDNERVIKIGDFGLVTHSELGAAGDENMEPSHGVSCQLTDQVGTHMYMSPEQLCQKPYNHKVDIYSLGLIFLEVLVPTTTGMERVKVLSEAKRGKFPTILAGSDEEELLGRLLNQSPETRPEVREVLEVPWIQNWRHRPRHNTSSSGELETVWGQDTDILCEEILDN